MTRPNAHRSGRTERLLPIRLTEAEYQFLREHTTNGQTVDELIRTTLAQVPAWNVEWHYLPHPDNA